MAATVMSEDQLGRKWDKCLTDSVLKLGGGILVGATFSLFFFKRRSWPIWLGSGFGIGMAYANCERDINSTLVLPGDKSVKPPPVTEKKS